MTFPKSSSSMDNSGKRFKTIHAPKVQFHLYKESLVVTVERHVVVLGRWTTIFGMWRPASKRKTRLNLYLDIFESNGNLKIKADYYKNNWNHEPGDIIADLLHLVAHKTIYSHQLPEIESSSTSARLGSPSHPCTAIEAWTQYLSDIPLEIRRIASRFTGMQWLVLEAVSFYPTILELLRSEEGWRFARVVFLLDETVWASEQDRRRTYRELAWSRRHKLLSRVSKMNCGRGSVRIVQKWSSSGTHPHVECKALVTLLNQLCDARMTKMLSHCDVINEQMVYFIDDSCIPSDWKIQSILRKVSAIGDQYPKIREIAEFLKIIENRGDREAMATRIGHALAMESTGQLYYYKLIRWFRRHLSSLVFPEPPVAYEPPLIPIRSYMEMREVGRRAGNCLETSTVGFAAQVLEGKLYCFDWHGKEHAVISIRCFGQQWQIDEMEKYGGGEILNPDPILAAFKEVK